MAELSKRARFMMIMLGCRGLLLMPLLLALPRPAIAAEAIPQRGLRLHLEAGCGVEVVRGGVTAWLDQSGHGHRAVPAEGFGPPDYPWATDPKPAQAELAADVCVVGGGSGGIGAALAAARQGARVVLVEREQALGGTGVNALVSGWEPGPGCSIADEIFRQMSRVPGATGVARWYPNVSSISLGQWYVTPGLDYAGTLRRAGVPREQMQCVPYDPAAFDAAARQLLDETGRVTVLDCSTFFHAHTSQAADADEQAEVAAAGDQLTAAGATRRRVESILVENASGRVTRIAAQVLIDCTGCIHLARAVGCEALLGTDPRERFNEPSAPQQASLQLNAISRCYQIRPSQTPRREPPPEPPLPHFIKTAHVTGWRDGPRVVNPLPMLPGRALIDDGYRRCLEITDRAVHAHWHWLQSTPEFAGYEFDRVAPMLGIRESYRLNARYMLTEHDLLAGLAGQNHDDIIAVADHPCDVHGAGGHLAAVAGPYGVPYRCLIPQGEWENLLVACRGSGFSKIAASSCRLQRTIIQLGHAAGLAAAMAAQSGVAVDRIDVAKLVQQLSAPARIVHPPLTVSAAGR